MCRSQPPTNHFLVSAYEKSPIHFERKSKNSDLAVSISSNFSKADARDLIANGRVVVLPRFSGRFHKDRLSFVRTLLD